MEEIGEEEEENKTIDEKEFIENFEKKEKKPIKKKQNCIKETQWMHIQDIFNSWILTFVSMEVM